MTTPLDPQVKELLTARNMAHVATLMSDGAPHVSPVWLEVLDDDRLAIFSTEAHLKIRNLRRDPRIAISVADEHDPYRAAVIRGRVVDEIHGERALAIADSMSRRYTGADFPVRSSIVMVIEPERVRLQQLPFEHSPR
ncbi:PPOX class F420-dependent enzyme [Actinomycetospora sp. NBRC 106375]|uniref:TIGR03618 family F420-dependent PPOX class oxidoreductase n=1 Tax=Actinomycetospora sp. NBRC 106375 TaxID=3032207 RepID=UPI0024A1AE2E|nr:TIGR03618 family F420-dependent PPOX class oxidoreductase [Actinomycetospora sp. NBRC 106375]GLZ44256.1 PPOX class F420-dependent enzyme [Actinomycetospora sp. NBRC 106375]